MAQPHQYPGDGGVPAATTATAYQESYQAEPFPTSTKDWTPGGDVEVTITRTASRSITDAATGLTISSINQAPPPHVEYGRTGDN